MPPAFSYWVLLELLAVFGVSCLMFYLQVRRWIHNRNWVALGDWARRHGFKLHRARRASVPAPLSELTVPPPNALVALVRRRLTLLQMDTPANARGAPPGAVQRWNVLVRETPSDWPLIALRPAAHDRSLVDLFSLASYPGLLSSDRFTIHGNDSSAARAVVGSMLMALLPQDLGLVLAGHRMILDFSTRPFDGIELSRIVSLTDQLVGHLPTLHSDRSSRREESANRR